MGNELRLDYEGIASSKQGLMEQKDIFDECYSRMSQIVNDLPSYWSGNTAISYATQFEDLTCNFTSVSQLIEDLATQLESISTNFSDTDSDMSSQVHAF